MILCRGSKCGKVKQNELAALLLLSKLRKMEASVDLRNLELMFTKYFPHHNKPPAEVNP